MSLTQTYIVVVGDHIISHSYPRTNWVIPLHKTEVSHLTLFDRWTVNNLLYQLRFIRCRRTEGPKLSTLSFYFCRPSIPKSNEMFLYFRFLSVSSLSSPVTPSLDKVTYQTIRRFLRFRTGIHVFPDRCFRKVTTDSDLWTLPPSFGKQSTLWL